MNNEVKLDQVKIMKLRSVNCWSQEELASLSGLSVRTIQRVEKSGIASLETAKALSSVFEVAPHHLRLNNRLEVSVFRFILKYSWLFAFGISSLLFGFWIVDILIPTLKGADFNLQYEMHGNFRYLDFGGISFVVGFLLLSVNLSLDFIERKSLVKNDSRTSD